LSSSRMAVRAKLSGLLIADDTLRLSIICDGERMRHGRPIDVLISNGTALVGWLIVLPLQVRIETRMMPQSLWDYLVCEVFTRSRPAIFWMPKMRATENKITIVDIASMLG